MKSVLPCLTFRKNFAVTTTTTTVTNNNRIIKVRFTLIHLFTEYWKLFTDYFFPFPSSRSDIACDTPSSLIVMP